ncbi:MAG: PEP-CTERM sorting domain-containing protein [Burkholderiales bacterium]|nr:MAG: PEP-CTERM sorting domain-containing protein [Burkholderiales bacterium]
MKTIAVHHVLRAAICHALFGLSIGAHAASQTTQFLLDGQVNRGGSYVLSDLQTLPAATQTVSFQTGKGPQTHTFIGTSLWNVLDTAGIQNNAAVKNDVLNKYVLATGSDGYKAVYSLGELSPNFGNEKALIAYAEVVNGATVSLGADGFARTTAPLDLKGGRYVSNLSRLTVQGSASTQASSGGGVSTSFSVTGDVMQSLSFNLAALQALPQISRTVGSDTFTGVSLWGLLSNATGLATDPAVKNDVLGMYVVATGSDGYKALFSLGELSPDFGGQPDLIAFDRNGTGLGSNGFARIIAANDVKAGRWVSNLTSLEVFHAVSAPVPEPSIAVLMLAGVVLLAGRRLKLPR